MKYFDTVKLLNINKESEELGLQKGSIGIIWSEEIRDRSFLVQFDLPNQKWKYEFDGKIQYVQASESAVIKIKDLEMVKSANIPDAEIISYLPGKNQNWPYKVEDGFIICVDGTKLNKIAYDYDS